VNESRYLLQHGNVKGLALVLHNISNCLFSKNTGLASYYTIEVDGKENKDSAWYYPSPKEAARQIKDYVAFWRGVKVEV
jgi:uncharacterized protein (DUF427 family)